MASNSARWGGTVYEDGDSIVITTDCGIVDMGGGGVALFVGVWSRVDGDDGDGGMVSWRGCNAVVDGRVLLLVVWCYCLWYVSQ